MKRISVFLLIILQLVSFAVYAGQKEIVKIAVAAADRSSASPVSRQAARCPCYLHYDGNGKFIAVIDNPYQDARRQAGPSAATFLYQQGFTIVIAGNFGSKMIAALEKNGLKYYVYQGNAGDAVNRFLQQR
jgi:predicted Fe-Mo cluster-binding NifX family protein